MRRRERHRHTIAQMRSTNRSKPLSTPPTIAPTGWPEAIVSATPASDLEEGDADVDDDEEEPGDDVSADGGEKGGALGGKNCEEMLITVVPLTTVLLKAIATEMSIAVALVSTYSAGVISTPSRRILPEVVGKMRS